MTLKCLTFFRSSKRVNKAETNSRGSTEFSIRPLAAMGGGVLVEGFLPKRFTEEVEVVEEELSVSSASSLVPAI